MGVIMLDVHAVMTSAGRDQNIHGRRTQALPSSAFSQNLGLLPNHRSDRQVGKNL